MSYYKFRECDDLNISTLEKQEIFFPSMAQLSDAFDGKFTQDERLFDDLQQKIKRRYVYCLFEGDELSVRDNRLMWDYYADGHKGFCIEYSSQILDGYKPYDIVNNIQENVWMRVKYTESAPETIRIEDNVERLLAEVLRTKNKQYEHEKEVRLLLHSSDIVKGCVKTTNAITHIYLGCNITPEYKERLIQITKNLKIPCSQMKIESGTYCLSCRLIFDPKLSGRE